MRLHGPCLRLGALLIIAIFIAIARPAIATAAKAALAKPTIVRYIVRRGGAARGIFFSVG